MVQTRMREVQGIMVGALAPPGIYLPGYYQHDHAGRLIDGPENFELDMHALIPRLVWMTEQNYPGRQ